MPNLFIVGAPKSGTTSLAKYLEMSGHVFFPDIKEPHFLYADKVKGKIPTAVTSQQEYDSLYPQEGFKWYGDASVFGLQFFEDTISNIKQIYGSDVYILIVLRNPVERAYSAYLQAKRYNENEVLDFSRAFKQNQQQEGLSPMLNYYQGSMYCQAVEAYLDSFENVKILFSEELFKDTPNVVAEVYDFLALDKLCLSKERLTIHNEGGKDLKGAFKVFLMKKIFTQAFRLRLKKLVPGFHGILKKIVFKYVYQKADQMSSEEYTYYLKYFEEDIDCLYQLLKDKRIEDWRKVK